MSQSGLTDPAREVDWDLWYHEHLRLMASVEGIDSAQRFTTRTRGYPPSTAVYTVRSAEVFEDPYYLRIRGLGEFLPLIDRRHYHRNLFAGRDAAPAVSDGEMLLVWDAPGPQAAPPGIEFAWLEAVAIDRSTPYRGIAVVQSARADELGDRNDIACYLPATPVYGKGEPKR